MNYSDLDLPGLVPNNFQQDLSGHGILIECTVDYGAMPEQGKTVCLINSDLELVWARTMEADFGAGTCTLEICQQRSLNMIRLHREYKFMDCYWGKRAELVLDPSTQWSNQSFSPEQNKILAEPNQDDCQTNSDFFEDGLDHEHCGICSEIIHEESPSAWKNSKGHWSCRTCHSSHVLQRDISFVFSVA